MNKTQENVFQAVSLLNASQIKGEKKVSSYNQISLMTYNLYMLSKWTAEVANCVLEGLLGEYHVSYIISYHIIPHYLSMNSHILHQSC